MQKDRILVTGALGFAGKHLCSALAERQLSLIPFSLDLRDKEAMMAFLKEEKPTQIYHLAAQPFVPKAIEDPWETQAINLGGTLTLLEGLHRNQMPARLLYVSSADIYGRQALDNHPLKESLTPKPSNPYSASKLASEVYCQQYSRYSPYLEVVIARPFNHIGVGQNDDFAIPNFCRQICESKRKAERTVLVGDLSPTRDFTHVKDIVQGYITLMEKAESGEVYNICSGTETSMQTILQLLIEISGEPIGIQVDPSRVRPTETKRLVGSFQKIAELGWSPKYPLKEILKEVYQTYAEKYD